MSIDSFFKVAQATERNVLSTVFEAIGEDGNIEIVPRNFANTSARVIFILKRANGQQFRVVGSPTVSRLFRSKELSVSELLSLEVVQEKSTKGDLIGVIELPEGSQSTERLDLTRASLKQFVPAEFEFNIEESIAF